MSFYAAELARAQRDALPILHKLNIFRPPRIDKISEIPKPAADMPRFFTECCQRPTEHKTSKGVNEMRVTNHVCPATKW